jgi:hypothetical protein
VRFVRRKTFITLLGLILEGRSGSSPEPIVEAETLSSSASHNVLPLSVCESFQEYIWVMNSCAAQASRVLATQAQELASSSDAENEI